MAGWIEPMHHGAHYVPLWTKSNFSFLEGASHPFELVEQAHHLGLRAIALTDRDGLYGVVQAHMRAQELGIKLLVGAQITLQDAVSPLVLLAIHRQGYAHLCQLISKGRLHSEKGFSCVSLEDLQEYSDGLLALSSASEFFPKLKDIYRDRLYALIARHLRSEEHEKERRLRQRAERCGIPTAAANEVLYHTEGRQALQDVLTCIRHGVALSTAKDLLKPNAEHYLKTPIAMTKLFADDPLSLQRTLEIAERCQFSLSELSYRYPLESIPDGKNTIQWLQTLTLHGARERYGEPLPQGVQEQLERELSLIHELDYGGYFLTMHEIVQFCRSENILCQGRGSAANSVVCYALGITAVCPIKLDLLFARFLSKERAEPPDIDLDIEHQRREEVIQWAYQRYGRRHAAMVANVIRYRKRSAVRDVGKALGFPLAALERVAKLVGGHGGQLEEAALEIDVPEKTQKQFIELLMQIEDFPRHLSIHPGGFLLGHDPVDTLVPIEPATMPGRTVIQWDKYAVEDLGLFKVDLLGLGALTHVHACFDLLKEHKGIELTMETVPHDDAATYQMVSKGDTVGTFQIESRAQMSMLPRLQPKTFYDLVIEVAIVRPGPIQGNMVHPYLKRRQGQEPINYPHPALERVLAKTLGVPIFQEQVMKIAMLVGDYTPGEADQLRRDMAAWKSSGRIERHHDMLVQRMIQHGIEPAFAEQIFSQIRGFGEYGFPESHAASFALIAYVTAYLRCHHLEAFVCALLNAQPMGFYHPSTIIEDAKRHGVRILPIDINHSAWDCTLETQQDQTCVRMGLRYIKGIGVHEKEAWRGYAKPPYKSIDQLVRAVPFPEKTWVSLVRAGAFESFGIQRRDVFWAIKEAVKRAKNSLELPNAETESPSFAALSMQEQIVWDYGSSHHSTRGHPMQSLRQALQAAGLPSAAQLNHLANGTTTHYVGAVICRQRPGTASGVTFFTLEDETGFVNLVVWRQVFEVYSVLARTATLLGVSGKVQSEQGVVHLIAEKLWHPKHPQEVPKNLAQIARNFR